jgi:hypothetical protein
MYKSIVALVCLVALGLCALVGARSQSDAVKLRLRLIDAADGHDMAGIVRAYSQKAGKYVPLSGLFNRLLGLKLPADSSGWHVVGSGGAMTTLPREKIRLEALCGLETVLATQEIDLTQEVPAEVTIKLDFIFRPEQQQLAAGNTHLHLMKISRAEADEYLRSIPAADRLRILFISYLERNPDDRLYVTNQYPVGDLPQFSASGLLINNGEEHRHNFQAYGQGYGHVMFLNIKELVKPVSLGPGLTGGGFDDRPLRPGIDEARRQGATVIWCHNTFGFEDVVNALTGRLHALNVFDGSRLGSYEDNYYRYLNLGLHMPISTGTDWFLYDFSRVYVNVPGKLTVPYWLESFKAGRTVATNGPLLKLDVAGKSPGDTIKLDKPEVIQVEASGLGRHDFQRLQLLHNGKVIKTEPAHGKNPYRARIAHQVRVDQPSWFAVRIDTTNKNELYRPLYAHSSPVYVEYGGKRMLDVDAARGLLAQIEEAEGGIRGKGRFSSPKARDGVLDLYNQAAAELRDRIKRRTH